MRLVPLFALALVSTASAAEQPKTWRFNTGPAPEVAVENVSGTIVVEAGPASEVRVDAIFKGGDESEHARWLVDARVEGGNVKVKANCQAGSCRSSVELRVKAPAGSRLALRGVSSQVSASGITGDARVETVSGAVKVANARELFVKTVSGDVKADVAGAVTAESVSGDLTLRSAGLVKAHSVSGDVSWSGACGASCKVDVNTVSGDLTVKAAPQSSFQVSFQTRSGGFDDRLGTGASGGRGGVQTRVGKGEGALKFQSVSGDLRLEKL